MNSSHNGSMLYTGQESKATTSNCFMDIAWLNFCSIHFTALRLCVGTPLLWLFFFVLPSAFLFCYRPSCQWADVWHEESWGSHLTTHITGGRWIWQMSSLWYRRGRPSNCVSKLNEKDTTTVPHDTHRAKSHRLYIHHSSTSNKGKKNVGEGSANIDPYTVESLV